MELLERFDEQAQHWSAYPAQDGGAWGMAFCGVGLVDEDDRADTPEAINCRHCWMVAVQIGLVGKPTTAPKLYYVSTSLVGEHGFSLTATSIQEALQYIAEHRFCAAPDPEGADVRQIRATVEVSEHTEHCFTYEGRGIPAEGLKHHQAGQDCAECWAGVITFVDWKDEG